MTEDFLQFVWRYRLFSNSNSYSTKGDKIEIIEVGKQNFDSGPDFFDARIKINGMLWAGNIEIHVDSSSWYKHGHHTDSAYDSVILHVVLNDNADVVVDQDRLIPCLCLEFEDDLYANYSYLMSSTKWIPCFDEIQAVEKFFVRNWLDRMLFERLERKSAVVLDVLKQNSNSWEETFYQILARYFGMKVNAEPFQQLARSIPLKLLAKQKSSLFQIEAMLFGQAGLLDECDMEDVYFNKLKEEYHFLRKKYGLQAMEAKRWKWLRLRPANFPTIRIAQFAGLVYQSSSLFSKVIECNAYSDLLKLFEIEVSDYWKNHYRFGVLSEDRTKRFGKLAVDIIIINAVVPLVFAYGESISNVNIKEFACKLLDCMGAEKNKITDEWRRSGVEIKTAYHSQALIHLKETYCDEYRCLQCEFGNRIIRLKSHELK